MSVLRLKTLSNTKTALLLEPLHDQHSVLGDECFSKLLRSTKCSSNRVMEENRVVLYVSVYGRQFGPPKKILGANDVLSLIYLEVLSFIGDFRVSRQLIAADCSG